MNDRWKIYKFFISSATYLLFTSKFHLLDLDPFLWCLLQYHIHLMLIKQLNVLEIIFLNSFSIITYLKSTPNNHELKLSHALAYLIVNRICFIEIIIIWFSLFKIHLHKIQAFLLVNNKLNLLLGILSINLLIYPKFILLFLISIKNYNITFGSIS